ncbi:MAG TPA: hypothetical protein DEP84_01825 [Chloroflexi bacterium]|nr:hypothetical protein [Chloroflexota bacterium]
MAARLGGVNLFAVAWCFLRTLAPWQWLVGAGGALVGGLALLQQGAGPLRSLATAVLTLTLLVGLLVLWAWQRTPTSSTGQGACLPTSSETSEDSDRASPATT